LRKEQSARTAELPML